MSELLRVQLKIKQQRDWAGYPWATVQKTRARLHEIANRVMSEGRPYIRRADGGCHVSLNGGGLWYYGLRWGSVRLEMDRLGSMWLDIGTSGRKGCIPRMSVRLWNRTLHSGYGSWVNPMRVKMMRAYHPQWGSYNYGERIER